MEMKMTLRSLGIDLYVESTVIPDQNNVRPLVRLRP